MDSVGEFLTRIRNAGLAGHEKVDVPSSKLRKGISNILKEAGFIHDYRVAKDDRQGIMRLYLKYDEKGKPAISFIKRVSRPGRRQYIEVDKIPKVRSGFGIVILSTNKGIMAGDEATMKRVGGEMLCMVW